MLSAIIITRNEARNIAACLESLAFCDERIVVDSGSDDDTVEIAAAAGVTVVSHPWAGFGAQKNFALAQAGGDWVQFESPHSVDEIRQARARVAGPLSFMRGKLPRYLSLDEHQALGVTIAWYPSFTHEVMYAALWDFMQDFQARGLAAWEAFQASRQGHPYPHPLRLDIGESVAKQRELEQGCCKVSLDSKECAIEPLQFWQRRSVEPLRHCSIPSDESHRSSSC